MSAGAAAIVLLCHSVNLPLQWVCLFTWQDFSPLSMLSMHERLLTARERLAPASGDASGRSLVRRLSHGDHGYVGSFL